MRIKCAAIKYEDKIYEGKSHSEIGIKMIRDKVLKAPYPHGDDQGFITECGKYVRRAPALMIAIRAGQVEAGQTINKHELFSEDLKGTGLPCDGCGKITTSFYLQNNGSKYCKKCETNKG